MRTIELEVCETCEDQKEIIIPRYAQAKKPVPAQPRLSTSISEEKSLPCGRTRLQRLASATAVAGVAISGGMTTDLLRGGRPPKITAKSADPHDPRLIEATAHHEAGHAVMAFKCRNSIRGDVWIDRRRNGAVPTKDESDVRVMERCRSNPKDWIWFESRVWHDLFTTLSGPLAEVRFLNGGRSPSGIPKGDTPDLIRVWEYLNLLGCGDFTLWLACNKVRRDLRHPRVWSAVEALAGVLMQKGRISADETEDLFSRNRVPQITKKAWIYG